MDTFGKTANSFLFWVFALVIVAVVVGGHTETLIANVGKMIVALTGVIENPGSKSK